MSFGYSVWGRQEWERDRPGSAVPVRTAPQVLSNHLAVDFNSAIVIAVADVLQQMRHFGKRALLSVTGEVLFLCLGLRSGIRLTVCDQKLGDTNTGYQGKM